MSSTATAPSVQISVGSTVEIEDAASGRHDTFQLVHSHDANPSQGRLSEISPVGKALIGRHAGDTAQVHTPRGLRELRILTVA